jgi:hypothetical protein
MHVLNHGYNGIIYHYQRAYWFSITVTLELYTIIGMLTGFQER